MQSTALTKHQIWGSVGFCFIIFVAFLWGVQGFVLATTTSTTSTDQVVADTTAPGISYVGAYNTTRNSETIQWNSNEPTDGLVEYGPTTAYGSSVSDANFTNNLHSLTLNGLTGGTLYHYRIRAKDAAGNTTYSSDFTFTTSVGCVQDSDCAGTPVWGGATFCNPTDSSPTVQVSKYQTKPACDAGTCTTKSAPAVWEDCGPAGKICGFASTGGGTFQCVLNPGVNCTLGSQIISACLCGSVSYAGYGYCCLGADQKPFQSSSACSPVFIPSPPPPTPPSPPPTPTSTTSTTALPPPPPVPSSSSDISLIGYWKFDGNGTNEVAGKPNAVIVGNAEFNSSGGKLGGFLYIPTAADWAKIPYNSTYDLPDSFTIEFWFRQRSNQSFNQNLIYKGTAPNNYNFNVSRWLWNQYNYGPVIAGHTAANTGFWTQPSNPNQLAHNAWHHVVFTKSPNYHAYYLDGALIGSKDITSSYNSEYGGSAKTPHNDIIIGDTAVDTDIDNLKIYNRALSAGEVADNGGFPQSSPSPAPIPPSPPPPPSTPTSTTSSLLSFPPSSATATPASPYVPIQPSTSTPIIFSPVTTSAPLLPSTFLEVICADGSRVPSGANCPALVVFICSNGEKVRSPHECIPSKPPEDAITLCVNHGGMWCADQCAPRGSICGGAIENGTAKVIDPAQVKEFEAQKRELIREIRLAERALRQAKQNSDVAEADRLKDKLEEVKLRESPDALRDLATLQQAAEKLNEKAEVARERRLQEPGAAEADARTKEKNLRGIKQQIRPFERHVVTLEGRVKEFEKAGVTVDPSVKAALAEARGIAQKIKAAKNYDAADEAVEGMLDVAATLNDLAPAMESASRVLGIARLLERQIVTADRALAQTVKLAKRLKIDSTEDINEMRALLEQAKVAIAAIKTGGIDTELLSEYAETQVIDAVDEIAEIADHFRIITNVRRHVTKVTSDLKQYDSRIRREERKKKDMTNVRALVDEGREHLAGLQKLVASRLTVENAEAMLELMRGINDVKEELDELLGIAKPSAIERDLERVIESGGAKVKSYNVDAVEKLLI